MSKNLVNIDEDKTSLYSIDSEFDYSLHTLFRNFLPFFPQDKLDIFGKFDISYIHESDIATASLYKAKNKQSKDAYKDFLYPMAIRYISKENTYVIERPPFQLEVDFRLGTAHSSNPKMHPITMWAPWTVLVFNAKNLSEGDFSDVKLFFNDGPINSLEDFMLPCFYPNTYGDSRICFSSSLNDFNDVLDISLFDNGNIGYIYNYIFNNYMMGGWNSDLDPNAFSIIEYIFQSSDVQFAANARKRFPTVSLLRNPIQNTDFYKSIFAKYPRSFTGKYKKYFDNNFSFSRTKISREKLYARNFIIYSMFTLEQKLSLISEMKQMYYDLPDSNYYKLSTNKLVNIIDYYSSEKKNSFSFIKSLYKDKSIDIDYQYKSYEFTIYLTHLSNEFISLYARYKTLDPIITLENFQKINKIILNNINNKDSKIAFIYNCEQHIFDVIVNYDPQTYITSIYETLCQKVSTHSSYKNSTYFLEIQRLTLPVFLRNIYSFFQPSLI